MTELVIQHRSNGRHEACALCGRKTFVPEGPQLYVAERPAAVCRECGARHAPGLVSLLDLATTARRVGRIGRHTLFPPLTALLDLARAAENYLSAAPPPRRRAV
jgi:hypothetical protein